MINTGSAPKTKAGKPTKSKPATRKPKGGYDDMSAKPAKKSEVEKAIKAGKARRSK